MSIWHRSLVANESVPLSAAADVFTVMVRPRGRFGAIISLYADHANVHNLKVGQPNGRRQSFGSGIGNATC